MARKSKRSKSPSSRRPPSSRKRVSNPAGDHFEFGGRIGAVGIPILLTTTIFALTFAANKNYKLTPYNLTDFVAQRDFPQNADDVARYASGLLSRDAFLAVFGWFGFQIALERVLPCEKVPGTLLRSGETLEYNVNGHLAFWVSLLCVVLGSSELALTFGIAPLNLGWIYDNYVQLAMASIVLSTALSVYLYLKSFARGALLALGGNTSSGVYNWFIGRELNPREGTSSCVGCIAGTRLHTHT